MEDTGTQHKGQDQAGVRLGSQLVGEVGSGLGPDVRP